MRDMIRGILEQSQYFGLVLSIGVYLAAAWLRKKTGLAVLSPILVASAFIACCLLGVGMSYEAYNNSAKYLSWLLTPATVCLAVPLYKQIHMLKAYKEAVAASIGTGVLVSEGCIFAMSRLLGLSRTHYVTLLPKSITTAIGMGVSEEAGGIVALTVMSIVLTGIFGSIICDLIFKVFKITHPMAKGLALGTSAHAMGTTKALELGEVEGAMSSLSIAVAGLMTAIVAPVAAGLM